MFNIMEFQYPFYFQKLVNKILIYMYRLSKKDQVVIGLNIVTFKFSKLL